MYVVRRENNNGQTKRLAMSVLRYIRLKQNFCHIRKTLGKVHGNPFLQVVR